MSHDPELLAASYLTTMRSRARRRFEAHLLACDPCWQEVALARRGRLLAETARDLAPTGLREDIRGVVTAAAALTADPVRSPRRLVAAAFVAVALLAGAATVIRAWPDGQPGPEPRAVIAAAVASYLGDRLPGTAVPPGPAPDLTSLNLHLVGARRGELGGVPVTMFAYRTAAGARLTILRSTGPFPEATAAREVGGTDDAWTARTSGVTIICAQGTHAMLLLGSDPALVRRAGALLHAI
jgi:anti-sigma factor RsiW